MGVREERACLAPNPLSFLHLSPTSPIVRAQSTNHRAHRATRAGLPTGVFIAKTPKPRLPQVAHELNSLSGRGPKVAPLFWAGRSVVGQREAVFGKYVDKLTGLI